MDIQAYWKAVLRQQPDKMRAFFHKDAYVNWHNTDEHFTVDEFITANCEYPGAWDGTLERVIEKGNLIITVGHVISKEEELSFHVVSFLQIEADKIVSIDEYWGDDGKAPQWRLEKHIGTSITSL